MDEMDEMDEMEEMDGMLSRRRDIYVHAGLTKDGGCFLKRGRPGNG